MTGIDAIINVEAIIHLAPNLSFKGPIMMRQITVPAELKTLLSQISPWLRSRVSLISGSKGAIANQAKKAVKNDIHAK
jgi:hypothetical protein